MLWPIMNIMRPLTLLLAVILSAVACAQTSQPPIQPKSVNIDTSHGIQLTYLADGVDGMVGLGIKGFTIVQKLDLNAYVISKDINTMYFATALSYQVYADKNVAVRLIAGLKGINLQTGEFAKSHQPIFGISIALTKGF